MFFRTYCVRPCVQRIAIALMFVTGPLAVVTRAATPEQDQARQILQKTGVTGGLIVHLGCGDGKLTAALHASDAYLVHGLDREAVNVRKVRQYIQSHDLYGTVSVDRLQGDRLPYIDNLVNLLVISNSASVDRKEIERVLAPGGVALSLDPRPSSTLDLFRKPWPAELDEWPHYLHDPQGTMVSHDQIVGPPRRLQWVGGPKWLRNHDFMASLSGMVSAHGRIFYIIDEGLRSQIYLPARWKVIARDAFNGTILWKRDLEHWFPQTWPFKSGPGYLPRRIVATADRVYVTLGINAPLTALDAKTGKTIRTYDQTASTEEVVLLDGVLYVVVQPDKQPFLYKHATDNRNKERDRANHDFGWSTASPPRTLMAIAADSGQTLWQNSDRVAPLTLAAQGKHLFYFDGQHIVALDRSSGSQQWISEPAGDGSTPTTGYAARMIVGDGVIVLSTKKFRGGRLVGLSATDGHILWQAEQPSSGHFSPEDLYLINSVVWSANTGKVQSEGTHFVAVDAKTGETKHDFIADNLHVFFMHQRCYPGRATERFLMTSGTGTEFLDLASLHCELHHWVRGACIYGLMPANGLLYKTPDTCACYYQSKLPHLCALAPAAKTPRIQRPESAQEDRLEPGPAYGELGSRPSTLDSRHSPNWPAYRHDNARSGATTATVPAKLGTRWQTSIGGRLSTMTAADGRLFVSAVDRHTVYALASDSGKTLWSYLAGGRVDSPPTLWKGLALFGCADGWVYCLRVSDGALVWRYRAAPYTDKLVSYQQVESVWPVHGSVLVHDGMVYCLAGRNRFVDGGMHLIRLNCMTGKLISETILDDKDPRTNQNLQTLIAGKAMPVANDDLLSSQEGYLYMAAQQFDLDGNPIAIDVQQGKERDQAGDGRHLFCPTGLLDNMWFHRSYFLYGRNAGEGHGEYTVPRSRTPVGRLMVFDEKNVYAFFANNVGNNINPRTSYIVYAADKSAAVVDQTEAAAGQKPRGKKRGPTATPHRRVPHLWELSNLELLANAMTLAGPHLFLAGPPDVADEEKTDDYVFGANEEINRQMQQQEQAWQGQLGALISVIATDTGEKLAQRKINAVPVWDGMIATEGKLYLALQDGSILCLGDD